MAEEIVGSRQWAESNPHYYLPTSPNTDYLICASLDCLLRTEDFSPLSPASPVLPAFPVFLPPMSKQFIFGFCENAALCQHLKND